MAYEFKHFTKLFSITLLAGTTLNSPDTVIHLDRDADFFWESISSKFNGQPFGVIFTDYTRTQLSDDFMGSFALQAAMLGVGVPYVLSPSIWCPAGSPIFLNLREESGSDNSLEILVHGQKRFNLNG